MRFKKFFTVVINMRNALTTLTAGALTAALFLGLSEKADAQCYVPRRGGATYYRPTALRYGSFGRPNCYEPLWQTYLGNGLVVARDVDKNEKGPTRLKPGTYLIKIDGKDTIVTIPSDDKENRGFNIEELDPNQPYLMEFNGRPGIVVVREYKDESGKKHFEVECTPLCSGEYETRRDAGSDSTSVGLEYKDKKEKHKKSSKKKQKTVNQ